MIFDPFRNPLLPRFVKLNRAIVVWMAIPFSLCTGFQLQAQENSSGSEDGPPRINLIGIPDGVRDHIVKAWSEADSARKDADKLGRLAMRYFVPAPPVAAECFDKASKLAPNNAKWSYYEALAFTAAYRRDDAIKALEQAAKVDAKYAPIFLAWGDALLSSDAKAAAEKYQQAINVDPKLARAHFGLGKADQTLGDTAGAIKHLNEAVKIAPQYAAAHALLAEIYNGTEKFKDAKIHQALSDSGTSAPPGNDPWLFDLFSECSSGTELLEFTEGLAGENRLDEAISLLEGAISRNGDDVTLLHALAVLLDKAGKYREAVTRFRRVLELAPAQLETVLYLGQALTHMDDFVSAALLIKEVVQQEPDNINALRLYSGLMLRLRRPEDAMPILDHAAKTRPGDSSIQMALAMGAFCMDRTGPCIEYFKHAKINEPSPGDTAKSLLSNLAQVLVDQRKAAAGVHSGLAPAPARRLGLLSEAMSAGELKADGKILSEYRDFFAKRAAYLARQGSFDEAVLFLRTGAGHPDAKLDPEVIAEFEKIADANEGDLGIRHVLARCLAASGDATRAIEEWEKIVKTNPGFEPAVIMLSAVQMQSGDYAKAEKTLRDSMQRSADSSPILNALAWCLATNPSANESQEKEALDLADKVCKKEPDGEPSYWDTLATAYAANGNFEKAVECEQSAIRLADTSLKPSGVDGFRSRLRMFELKVPYRVELASPDKK